MLDFGKNWISGTYFPVKDVKIYVIEDGGKAREAKIFYKTKEGNEVKPLPENSKEKEELLLNIRKELRKKHGPLANNPLRMIHLYIPVEELKEKENLIVISFKDEDGNKGHLSEWVKGNPKTEIKGFFDVCKIKPLGIIGKSRELIINGADSF